MGLLIVGEFTTLQYNGQHPIAAYCTPWEVACWWLRGKIVNKTANQPDKNIKFCMIHETRQDHDGAVLSQDDTCNVHGILSLENTSILGSRYSLSLVRDDQYAAIVMSSFQQLVEGLII